jgi:hypothetical protein
MPRLAWLGLIPVVLNLTGVFFANRVQPLILGVPFFLAWIVGCVLATAVVMWIVYRNDPANRGDR